eukprot:8600059-Prorocentrum_lima.AAC.1
MPAPAAYSGRACSWWSDHRQHPASGTGRWSRRAKRPTPAGIVGRVHAAVAATFEATEAATAHGQID